jgi:hypothetical protein
LNSSNNRWILCKQRVGSYFNLFTVCPNRRIKYACEWLTLHFRSNDTLWFVSDNTLGIMVAAIWLCDWVSSGSFKLSDSLVFDTSWNKLKERLYAYYMRPVVWWTYISFVSANSLLSWWSLRYVRKYQPFMKTEVSFLYSLKVAVEPRIKWTGIQIRKAVSHFLTYWLLQWGFVSLICVRNSPLLAVRGCLFKISAAALSWRSPSRKTEDAPRLLEKDRNFLGGGFAEFCGLATAKSAQMFH